MLLKIWYIKVCKHTLKLRTGGTLISPGIGFMKTLKPPISLDNGNIIEKLILNYDNVNELKCTTLNY